MVLVVGSNSLCTVRATPRKKVKIDWKPLLYSFSLFFRLIKEKKLCPFNFRTFNIAPSSLVLCLILSLLIATSIVGNILVCIAVATDKHLRKLSNLFLVSLAVADLLVAAVVMPVALLNDLALETWPFGMTFCKVWIASDVMCSTASIINLCAISLDRYVHIKDPLQYTEWITRRTVPISIAVIWILSALMSFLPISLNLHMASGSVPENDSCTVDFNPSYSIISSVISFFVPCFIMLFIYFHVYSFARYHMECIKEQSKPLLRLRKISQNAANGGNGGAAANGQSNDESQDGIIAENDLQHHHNVSNGTTAKAKTSFKERTTSLRRKPRKKSKLLPDPSASPLYQEHKAAITIGIIMGIFLLCWTPFFIVNIISGLCKVRHFSPLKT